MICWVIKNKGKGYEDEDDNYGKLTDASMYPTRKEAMADLQEDGEDVVKIEIRVLD